MRCVLLRPLCWGSFSNQDGRSNGLTAPNPMSQAALLTSAWLDAGGPCFCFQSVLAYCHSYIYIYINIYCPYCHCMACFCWLDADTPKGSKGVSECDKFLQVRTKTCGLWVFHTVWTITVDFWWCSIHVVSAQGKSSFDVAAVTYWYWTHLDTLYWPC